MPRIGLAVVVLCTLQGGYQWQAVMGNNPSLFKGVDPAGTRLEEFVIERVLGIGGLGITYLARDTRESITKGLKNSVDIFGGDAQMRHEPNLRTRVS
jgi:hypothetical protein